MNLFDLTGKKAIVTGGTRGLGYGMAEGLIEAGAEVVIFGSSERVHDVAAGLCHKGLKCHGIAVDLGDSAARAAAFDEAVKCLGGLDILVNCAGIQRRHKSEEFPLDDLADVMNINLLPALSFVRWRPVSSWQRKSLAKSSTSRPCWRSLAG